jgi:PPM family protein phosphatase
VTGLALRYAVRSDLGRRPNNEDAVFASPRVVAVADGVGGSAAGEVASRTVIDAVAHMDKCRLSDPVDSALRAAVASGNDAIGFLASCRPLLAGMSTTLTAIALAEDEYAIANIGDSRTYLFRDARLTQLTRDDSYVQELIDSGDLTTAAARHHPQRSIVLEALDGDARRSPSVRTARAQVGDRLLLCSDGLSDMVEDDALEAALSIPSRDQCADRLVELALAAGGRDNVSVIVADVVVARDGATGWA